MIGGAFLLCNVIMLIIVTLDPTISYAQIYPLMSAVAAAATLLLLFPTLYICREQPGSGPAAGGRNAFAQLFIEFRGMHRIFYLVMLPLLLGWISYTPLQQFMGVLLNGT